MLTTSNINNPKRCKKYHLSWLWASLCLISANLYASSNLPLQSQPVSATAAQQCAIDLCGKPNEVEHLLLTPTRINQLLTPQEMQPFEELLPKLQDIINRHLKLKTAEIQSLIDTAPDDGLDIRKLEMYGHTYSLLASIIYDPHINFTIEYNQPVSSRVSWKINDYAFKDPLISAGAKAYANEKKQRMLSHLEPAMSNDPYSPDELRAQLYNHIKYIGDKRKKDHVVHNNKKTDLQTYLKEVEATISRLNDDQLKQYDTTILRELNKLHNLSQGRHAYSSAYEPDDLCQSNACQQGIVQRFRNLDLEKLQQQLDAYRQHPERVSDEIIEYCRSHYAFDLLNTKSRNYTAQHDLATLKAYTDNALSWLSPETRKSFQHYVQHDVSINYYLDTGIDLLPVNKIAKAYADRDNIKSYLPNRLFDLLDIDKDQHLRPLSPFCTSDILTMSWDSFYATTGYSYKASYEDIDPDESPAQPILTLSYWVQQHTTQGKSIYMRELGHILSYMMRHKAPNQSSLEAYQKRRQCIANSGITTVEANKQHNLYHEGDTLYTENTLANYLAANATKSDGMINNCRHMEPGTDENSYKASSLQLPVDDSSYTPPLIDSLREAKMKNMEIPESCQPVINQHPALFSGLVCFTHQ